MKLITIVIPFQNHDRFQSFRLNNEHLPAYMKRNENRKNINKIGEILHTVHCLSKLVGIRVTV